MSLQMPFHPVVSDWFLQTFKKPSLAQTKGWPVIAEGKHTLILAPTGSGKTLAAFLWCIDELFRMAVTSDYTKFQINSAGIHTLYVSPLKALNNDIHKNLELPLSEIEQICQQKGLNIPKIRSSVRTGDTPSHIRQAMVRKPPHILITTPESLYLLLTSERSREQFHNLRYLIVDEIHAVSSNKRGVHLSLSMERLMVLCDHEPTRIGLSATQKPLPRIAAFLGGQSFNKKTGSFVKRPVTIIDCRQKKKMDSKVLSPVPNFGNLPESTVWPAVIEQLYALINKHRTTLIFVNMRAQTEKIARQLNDLHQERTDEENAKIAWPHHGSMSREMRYDVEEKLKKGEIPAVIATASLELGIDIGSIDLVIQLEAPKSVSGALQRIGRSGHLLTKQSKGRIIPLYPSDLDDAVALNECIIKNEIEDTTIPENCLDVLAQQIVAEVSMQNWSRKALFNLFKQSYCYRLLSQNVFDDVLAMLGGRYSNSKLPSLQPRLTWDKINDNLIARRGLRLLAVMNGGTIPDRGYYTVYLSDSNSRLGEMEEEFVFESRVGDVFYLGNSEWQIENISQDRIIVTPVRSIRPRAPFWKGEIPYREFSTSEKIGEFRAKFKKIMKQPEAEKTLIKNYNIDRETAKNLLYFLEKQKGVTKDLPTNKLIIAEWFYDTTNEINLVIHASFGGRVLAAWAIALAHALEQKINTQVQYEYNDDGLLLRIITTTDEPPIDYLLNLSESKIRESLIQALASTPIFAIQFRYNAARALLLTRSQPGKRIPLWLQRLRSADLLQSVLKYSDFPLIAETYRTCLHDILDFPSLLEIINRIQKRSIHVSIIKTSYPSPMAAGLLFNFLSSAMYEQDRSRAPAQIASVSSQLLAQILNKEIIPRIVSSEIVKKLETRLQFLSPESQASNKEDLFAVIESLGPIEEDQLVKRTKFAFPPSLKDLLSENRIIKLTGVYQGWISRTHEHLFLNPLEDQNARILITHFLEVRGPVSIRQINETLHIPEKTTQKILESLYQEQEIVKGDLIKDQEGEYWCNRNNFAQLYRSAVSLRRQRTVAVNRLNFYNFLLCWHQLNNSARSVIDIIEHYRGLRFPLKFFESELLHNRLSGNNTDSNMTDHLNTLNGLVSNGDVIIKCEKENSEAARPMVEFILRGEGNLIIRSMEKSNFVDNDKKVVQFLQENGASLSFDIVKGTGISNTELKESFTRLLKNGILSCDSYRAIKVLIQIREKSPKHLLVSQSKLRKRSTKSFVKQKVTDQMILDSTRWFLIDSFAVRGKILTEEVRVEKQTFLLLKRYGILVKELYRKESNFVTWYKIFQNLKKLEWQGKIHRGYFIEGLSGIQFALPEAVDLLEKIQTGTKETLISTLLSTFDPALPFGVNLDWELYDSNNDSIKVTRSPGNHIVFIEGKPGLYCENYATRLWTLKWLDRTKINVAINMLKNILNLPIDIRPKKHIVIEMINNHPPLESSYVHAFLSQGFEREGDKLVLWPSGM